MWVSKKRLRLFLSDAVMSAIGRDPESYAVAEQLRKEITDLKETKLREEREIKHLVKMEKEAQVLSLEKEKMKMASEFAATEKKLQQDFFNKNMELIQTGHKQMQDIYAEILKRLPNVSMRITEERK